MFIKKVRESRNTDVKGELNLIKTLVNAFEITRNDIDENYCEWYQETLRLVASVQINQVKGSTVVK